MAAKRKSAGAQLGFEFAEPPPMPVEPPSPEAATMFRALYDDLVRDDRSPLRPDETPPSAPSSKKLESERGSSARRTPSRLDTATGWTHVAPSEASSPEQSSSRGAPSGVPPAEAEAPGSASGPASPAAATPASGEGVSMAGTELAESRSSRSVGAPPSQLSASESPSAPLAEPPTIQRPTLRLVRSPEPAPTLRAEPSELERSLRLERNLALFAGAGAGKTYSLITLCLHLLGGARRDRKPLSPSNLCLLTFTDKAASEMRQRLRERLDRLATGTHQEPELAASFAELGRPFPPASFWRSVRDDLGAASIGTFHSVMTQVLRRAPSGAGVNPSFELLEERDARDLFAECVERVVMQRLEANDPHVRALVRDFGYGAESSWGLVMALVRAAGAIREDGSQVDLVSVQDREEAKAAFLAGVRGLRLAATQVQRTLDVRNPNRPRVDELCRHLAQVTLESWPEHRDALDEASKGWRQEDLRRLRETLQGKAKDGVGSLGALWCAWLMAPYDATVRELVREAIEAYERALDDRGALDFTGLLVRARELLRTSVEARRDAQRRFQVVLVDEFQDTNRVQLELVLLLAERRDGAPRPLSRELGLGASNETLEFPLEPASLAVVGDRKQAIYDFRGADVAVFERMARCIEANEGVRQFLQQSRRSTADVVELCNNLSAHFLVRDEPERSALPFEVEFDFETDALSAVRTDTPPGPALVRLATPPELVSDAPPVETLRAKEADALARYLARLLADPTEQVVPKASKDRAPRMVRGGDVAVLFQRFTQLETYRQALVRHGVRHRIVRGRGFFAAQEVIDLASLLQVIADPSNVIACAAVLRSPLVALSDAALASLALDGSQVRGLDASALLVRRELGHAVLDEGERTRLDRFLTTFEVLHRERDRLGLRQLLRVALEALELEVRFAAGPFGEQALANVTKLLELAADRERRGVPLAAFARELLELADTEPKEAQGDVLDDGDAEAVTLLTAHQAKGLEWPVVVLPELFAAAPAMGERIRFDRDAGLAVAPLANEPVASARFLQCRALKSKRDEAQRRRLLYVALTRARDRVVLGFMPSKHKGTWAAWLAANDIWWNGFHQRGAAIEVNATELPEGRPSARVPERDAVAEVELIARKVARPPRLSVRDALLPVTQLQDFVTCPRRYQLAHQIGLAERPLSFEWQDDAPGDDGALGDPRRLGTAAHKLLELTPLEWVGRDELRDRLVELQRTSGVTTDSDEQVIDWAMRFWSSSYGRALPSARRVLRELPFVLQLKDGDFSLHLRGQIDLLVVGEQVEVIDYKTSLPSEAGLEPYLFQLGCYVLAARRLLQSPAVEVRAGISFLRDDDASPRFASLDLAPLEAALVAQARQLVSAQSTRRWDGRPLERCVALGCGHRDRCHPRV